MKQTKLIYILIFILFILHGCGVQKASLATDIKSKQLTAPTGKGIVYIIRPNAYGFAVKFKVTCDENYIGSTFGKRFIYAVLDPGKHQIISKAENDADLEVNIEADKIYYIEQIPKMGLMMARNKLELLSVGGKEKLTKCKLSLDCAEK